MKLYVQPEAIPGIWEYLGEQSKHNISNELVKENICKSLAPMCATTDKGRIATCIADEHHFHNRFISLVCARSLIAQSSLFERVLQYHASECTGPPLGMRSLSTS